MRYLSEGAAVTAEELVKQFMAVMDEARGAANRSVLDGTISCQTCRALVLEQNREGHKAWHQSLSNDRLAS
jgi:hypothetical protein